MTMTILSIAIEEFTGHKDILLTSALLSLEECVDSYYFLIDNGFMSREESFEKVAILLKNLLNYWTMKVEALGINDIVYLPFDLSDEYLGCFRIISLENDKIDIDYGYTRIYKGWSIVPSNIENTDLVLNESDYTRTTETMTIKKSQFIEDIQSSIIKFK